MPIYFIVIHFLFAILLNFKLYEKNISFFMAILIPLLLSFIFLSFIITSEHYFNKLGRISYSIIIINETLSFAVTWIILFYT